MSTGKTLILVSAILFAAFPALGQERDQSKLRMELHGCISAFKTVKASDLTCSVYRYAKAIEWTAADKGLIRKIEGLLTESAEPIVLEAAYALDEIGPFASFTAKSIERAAFRAAGDGGIKVVIGRSTADKLQDIAESVDQNKWPYLLPRPLLSP